MLEIQIRTLHSNMYNVYVFPFNVVPVQFTLYTRGGEEERRTMLTSELPLYAQPITPRKIHIMITEMVMMLQIYVVDHSTLHMYNLLFT